MNQQSNNDHVASTFLSELDGVNHYDTLLDHTATVASSGAREILLYNILSNVSTKSFNISTDAPFAIRNSQYKLIHEYSGNSLSQWTNNRDDIDDISTIVFCTPSLSLVGKYTKMLFDLKLDPFEMKNQFHNEDLEDIKVSVQ